MLIVSYSNIFFCVLFVVKNKNFVILSSECGGLSGTQVSDSENQGFLTWPNLKIYGAV